MKLLHIKYNKKHLIRLLIIDYIKTHLKTSDNKEHLYEKYIKKLQNIDKDISSFIWFNNNGTNYHHIVVNHAYNTDYSFYLNL